MLTSICSLTCLCVKFDFLILKQLTRKTVLSVKSHLATEDVHLVALLSLCIKNTWVWQY